MRTTIRNQNLAHRPRNVDSRGSVAISKVHKHLFEIREQPSNVFTTEDAIRKTIKNEALASQLMQCVETAQQVADRSNGRFFVTTFPNALDPFFLRPAPVAPPASCNVAHHYRLQVRPVLSQELNVKIRSAATRGPVVLRSKFI